MKAPKKPEAPEMDPPKCLTDGSNDPIPHDYIAKWKVTDNNKEQRLKELKYTIEFLKKKGVSELVLNSKQYERDFYLLCKGMFKTHNTKLVNRQAVLETLLASDLVSLLVDYWEAIVIEFELKRKDAEEGTTVGLLWRDFTQKQKHLIDSLTNCYNVMIIFWNGSDNPVEETLRLIYEGLVDFMLKALDCYLHPLDVDSSHPQHGLVKSFLGTLHNCCNKYDPCVPDLRQKDALRIVAKYRNASTSTLKSKSILVCSYLLTEKDETSKSVVELDQSDIDFLGRVLEDALHSNNELSKKYGYNAQELITGLNNMAIVESNKRRLVQGGVLPLYVEAMGNKKPGLQEAAAKAIWTLAFDSENLNEIKAEAGCMLELKQLAQSDIPHVKAAADGALWKIEGETAHRQKLNTKQAEMEEMEGQGAADIPSRKGLPHIMLSYQWGVKDQVLKIRQRLKALGYRVWIDVEQMTGNTLQSMAKAVEHAVVFVPVLTEKYKGSPSCRQEAEYSHFLQKKMVPVRLQPKYRPDGWLGFLLGSTYFYDLSNPSEYESKLEDFVKAIGEDGKILPGEDENPVYEMSEDEEELTVPNTDTVDTQAAKTAPVEMIAANVTVSNFDVDSLKCLNWSCKQVSDWLTDHKLGKYVQRFEEMDGELLAELIAMRFTCADVYYDIMRNEHNMMSLDLLRFNSSIRQLVNSSV